MATSDGLGGLFDGYEGYRTVSLDEHQAILKNGMVVLDTNVLLDLYRYGKSGREQVFKVLESIAKQLFMPAQVQAEFWRNRDAVVREVISFNSVAGLREARKRAASEVVAWGERTMDAERADELRKPLESAFQVAISTMEKSGGGVNFRAAIRDVKDDPVLQRLQPLLEGRVGKPFSKEKYAELIVSGRRRFAAQTPPGYMDADKSGQIEEGTGDYLIWEQLLDACISQGRDVLFVTRDQKEDWWRLDAAREPIGPRFELIAEMSHRAGAGFFMMAPQTLLEVASAMFGLEVSESTLDSAAGISESLEDDGPLPWSRDYFDTLLAKLRDWGYSVQADVLWEAATDSKGFVARERVYELGNYAASRYLTGFTRPVLGTTESLVASNDLPAGLEVALHARYLRPGKAAGFQVPRSIVEAAQPSASSDRGAPMGAQSNRQGS